jgi:hypothetical protein
LFLSRESGITAHKRNPTREITTSTDKSHIKNYN